MEAAFWDSSSLIPLCVRQVSTSRAEALTETLSKVVWWGASVEMQGSFARLQSMGSLAPTMKIQAQIRLDHMRRLWREVLPTDELRARAEIHVEKFGLTEADAFQLAAAWTWCSGSPRGRPFIAGDKELLRAANELGFTPYET